MTNYFTSSSKETELQVRPGGMLVQRRDGDDPDHSRGDDPFIKLNVVLGSAQLEVYVPAQSTFGELKRIIEQATGLECGRQKLLFRGKVKEDGEYLHDAGIKDKGTIFVLEEPVSAEKELPGIVKGREEGTSTQNMEEDDQQPLMSEVKESEEILKAIQAIVEVRAEVDNLAEKVSLLEVAVNGGTKVTEQELMVSGELLMRQLLKLDMIEAEGEARAERKAAVSLLEVAVNGGTKVTEQELMVSGELLMRQLLKLDMIEAEGEARAERKAAVLRIQKLHELLDNLKAANAKPVNTNVKVASVTTRLHR